MIAATFIFALALVTAPSPASTMTLDDVQGPLGRETLVAFLVRAAEEDGDPMAAARARRLLEVSPLRVVRDSTLLLARACLASRPQDFGCARRALEQARAAGADAREVDQRLGLIAAALGEDDLARGLLERGTPGGPHDAEAALTLARLALTRGDAVAAEATLRHAVAQHPDHARLLALLGRVLADRHPNASASAPALAEAVASLDAALAADPSEPSSRLLRARIRARAEPASSRAATDLAVHEVLVRATELGRRPAGDANARRERAMIAAQLVALEPKTPEWRLEQVRALTRADQRADALAALTGASASWSTRGHLATAAMLAWSLGDAEQGLDLARRCLARPARTSDDALAASIAHQAAGGSLLRLGRAAEALAELKLALVNRAHRADLRTLIAEASLATGQRQAAVSELRAGVQLDPRDARALASLGGLLREDGLQAEASVLLDEAIRVDPREPSARANHALLLHDQGHDVEAVSELLIAVELAPQDRVIRWNLGALLVMAGRMKEAVPHLEAAVAPVGSGPPAPPAAREWLERARKAAAGSR